MNRTRTLFTYLGIALLSACSSPGDLDFDCADGTCDVDAPDSAVDPHACDSVLIDRSGRGVERMVNRLDDPFVNKLYKAESDAEGVVECPNDFDTMIAKLKETDGENCNIQTRVVSEQGQILNKDDNPGEISYRAVTSRVCDGRGQEDFIFSAFGFNNAGGNPMDINESGLPEDVEVMAFSESEGVYNYYKAIPTGSGTKVFFFGTSKDYVTSGPEGPGLTDVKGCGNCHTGGGPIMKELDSPWIHWQPDVSGGRELVKNREEAMGRFTLGEFLESGVVEPGNKKWNTKRIEILRENGQVAELLRPLMCPVEMNIQTGSKSSITNTFMYDPILARDFQFRVTPTARANVPNLSLNSADYDLIIDSIDQDNEGLGEDVKFPFSFVERSFADGNFVEQLVSAGVIDEQLVTDILMVDFTRPLHSDSRCGILGNEAVAGLILDKDDQTPEKIRQALIGALDGSEDGSPEAQLHAYLSATEAGASADHQATLDTFKAACEARKDEMVTIQVTSRDEEGNPIEDEEGFVVSEDAPVKAIHLDLMKLRSLQRKLVFGHDGILDLDDIIDANSEVLGGANGFNELFQALKNIAFKPASVFEFDGALPSDQIQVVEGASADATLEIDPDAHLSPVDCRLTTGFVSIDVAAPESELTEDNSCEVRGCTFRPGASCQCNDICTDAGDCCDDFEAVCGE